MIDDRTDPFVALVGSALKHRASKGRDNITSVSAYPAGRENHGTITAYFIVPFQAGGFIIDQGFDLEIELFEHGEFVVSQKTRQNRRRLVYSSNFGAPDSLSKLQALFTALGVEVSFGA